MEKIEKYDVVVKESITDLVREVNTRISDGWEPLGSVIVSNLNQISMKKSPVYYYQTLVKTNVK